MEPSLQPGPHRLFILQISLNTDQRFLNLKYLQELGGRKFQPDVHLQGRLRCWFQIAHQSKNNYGLKFSNQRLLWARSTGTVGISSGSTREKSGPENI